MFSESKTAEEESVTEEEDDEGDEEDQEKKSSVSWFLCSLSYVHMWPWKERKSYFFWCKCFFFIITHIQNRKQSWSWQRSCLISWSTARVSTSVGLRIPGTSSPFMRWPPSKREKLWNWRRNQVWCHDLCCSDTTQAIKHMRRRLGLCPAAQIYYAAKYTVRNVHNVTDDGSAWERPLTQLWIWKRAGD